jgi:type IV fimbrial biogenesis protein FimT
MRSGTSGLTLIEVLIVVAIAGILLAIAGVQLSPAGAATRQAAQVLSASVNQARFEAIRSNNTTGLEVVGGTPAEPGLIRVCSGVDESVTLSCATGTYIREIRFSGSDLARAVITGPAETVVFFDRRGIVRNPTTFVITIADRNGGNGRTVTILPTGRAEVQ